MSQENIDVVKQVLAAFSRCDFDTALACLHHDVVLEMPDEDPLFTQYVGREGGQDFLDLAPAILG